MSREYGYCGAFCGVGRDRMKQTLSSADHGGVAVANIQLRPLKPFLDSKWTRVSQFRQVGAECILFYAVSFWTSFENYFLDKKFFHVSSYVWRLQLPFEFETTRVTRVSQVNSVYFYQYSVQILILWVSNITSLPLQATTSENVTCVVVVDCLEWKLFHFGLFAW